jgi:hypothetical protein
VDEADRRLRNVTYRMLVERGRAPTAAEVAAATPSSAAAVEAGWRRLHEAHALVLHQTRPELRMANPFSAVPTAHRARVAGRWWYASCAWDVLGICAALHADGEVATSCPDCGEAVAFEVVDGQPTDEALLFHCLVPARSWWVDIGFT